MSGNSGLWIASSSPHIHQGDSVRKIMLSVLLALVPALLFAVWRFGLPALRVSFACVSTCVLAEAAARRLMGRDLAVDDFSAAVTGLLLAFNLPPSLPTWMCVVGSLVAVVVAKQLFGGLGYNPFNPALVGRVFLLVSCPVAMTAAWSAWAVPGADAVTTATPLGYVKTALTAGQPAPFVFDGVAVWAFFLGFKNGSLGEVSGLALLAGGLYLLWRRCISWHVPVSYLGTVALLSGALWLWDPARNMSPLFHLLSGGLILGAFFMATDMVTTPVTRSGLLLFGLGCGVLTVAIRKFGGYPEGVAFSILIMNAVTPLINRATRPRVFGRRRPAASGGRAP
jgi:electron transport complex protein RnfD